MARNRAKHRLVGVTKAHQRVISIGELFLEALNVHNDLSRRAVKQPMSRTLQRERRKQARLVSQLAREYKTAMADYLAAIRIALRH